MEGSNPPALKGQAVRLFHLLSLSLLLSSPVLAAPTAPLELGLEEVAAAIPPELTHAAALTALGAVPGLEVGPVLRQAAPLAALDLGQVLTHPATVIGGGSLVLLAGLVAVALFGGARVWQSVSPFVRSILEQRAKTSTAAGVLLRVQSVSDAVVADLEATRKAAMERANADGVITSDEARELRDEGIKRLISSIGEHGLEELGKVLGLGAQEVREVAVPGLLEQSVLRVSAAKAAKLGGGAAVLLSGATVEPSGPFVKGAPAA